MAEGVRGDIHGGAGAGFCAVRSECDAAGEEGRGPAPGLGGSGRGAECKQGRCRWTNKGVDGLPDGIDVGEFVGEKFHDVKNAGDGENKGMGEDLEMFGEVDDAETLEEAESGDSGVDVQAGSKTGAGDEADSFEEIKRPIKFQISTN